jgi:5-methylcytosine-specific restriction endonuclease McrA
VRLIVAALTVACACIALPVVASGGGYSYAATNSTYSGSHSKAAPGIQRDSHGNIARDPRQLNSFKKQHPCPATGKTYGSCPGYTVDHVIPLKRGGADSPSNMQWQTNAAAKEKDKWE